MALQGSQQRTSRLSQMQMRFQQKQQVEKEQKKIDLLGNSSVRVGRISSSHDKDDTKLMTSTIGAGKVRQMFEERRTGVDKSYPLKPISGNIGKNPLNSDKVYNVGNIAKSTPKSKAMNGNVNRQKPPAQQTDNEFQNLDRDPLNNSVSIQARYNSTNRVPSLKNNNTTSVTSNQTTINNNNSQNVVDNTVVRNFKPNSTSGMNRVITPTTASINYPLKEKKPSLVETRKIIGRQDDKTKISSPLQSPTKPTLTEKQSPKKAFAPPPEGMVQCSICGRNFLEERIAKHETICSKAAAKKRKVFDSTKARVAGTEAEVYVKKANKAKTKAIEQKVASKKGDWRRKHEDFINAIRAAKEVQAHIKAGKDIRDLPPPPPSDYSDYVQCPHCSRKFNESAAERHIPKCATMLHNKTKKPVAKGRR
ncbi:zinc finger C2HC domain-containing protein 1C [Culicoides brevitarsis]|uniref:zinc finger C2HC domain-containing protein 1C n=1 Tax=Culicoides brevitarsis TaxID=469753 RepID=UPI00307CB59A